MVAQRRLQPLGFALVLGLGVVAARLFQVQIVEHEVWAAQAQRFRTSSSVVPYHRGRFLDREGRLLVADEDVASLEFVYRDFRRSHPLGLAAHARTAIEGRPVELAETEPELAAWCASIVAFTPDEITAFARGGALRSASGIEFAPAVLDAEAEARGQRAADLRYYALQILGLTRRDIGALNRRIADGERDHSLVALAVSVRAKNEAELGPEMRTAKEAELVASVVRRAEESRADLRRLAEMLAAEEAKKSRERGEDARSESQAANEADAEQVGDSLARLLALFDRRRADLDDEAADELFETACGFGPGRIPTEALRDTFDVAWIARALRWDPARVEQWIATRRGDWERGLDEFLLPRVLARADLGETEKERAQRLLDGLADLWRVDDGRAIDERSWTDLAELTVLHEAPSLFRSAHGDVPDHESVLPFQDEAIREQATRVEDPWLTVGALFDAAALQAGLASPGPVAIADRWREFSNSRGGLDGEAVLAEVRRVARTFEAAYSGAVLRALSALRGAPTNAAEQPAPLALVGERVDRARDSTPLALVGERVDRARDSTALALVGERVDRARSSTALTLVGERVDRARQRERYVLVDAQSRSSVIASAPEYELIRLVARDPERYAGFRVRETTRRVARTVDAQGVPAASLWIGGTRRPFLRELVAQSEDERRLASLQYRLMRTDEEERELRELSTRLAQVDEWTGDDGLEAWFDLELRGRFGSYETEGLDEEASGESARFVPAVDGQDIVLTLDANLQIAAQDVLAHPRFPESGRTDRLFAENPVGAIVLLAPDGEILAAASEPTLPGHANIPGRFFERSRPRERTAQTPTFNPPGSVFKPFVSAYALDRLTFDPSTKFACVLNDKGQPAFESLRCAALHHESDLHHALVVSCNSYFAQLGLRFEPAQLLEAAHVFGFGEPTGVRYDPRPERRGLREDWVASPTLDEAGILKELKTRSVLLRFPNGLGLLWSSPLQVARATAGLATGTLPDVRIVARIGERSVENTSRPLGISETSLGIVRDAMRACVTEVGGSGHGKGLDVGTLGFSFACKTGSADIGEIRQFEGMPEEDRAAGEAGKSRKHTWVTGWFPAENPVAIVVVYLHNVTETASHTAVHVAAQYLQSPAVREFVARKGAQ